MAKKREFGKVFLAIGVLFLLLSTGQLSYGGTLSGKVSDTSDGSPIYKATVNVKSEQGKIDPTGDFSDETGMYMVEDLPEGTYTIMVSSIGYTTQKFEVVSLGADEDKKLDINLEPGFINLNKISVTASRRPEKISEAPASISVVDSEEIEDRTTLTPTDHVKGLPSVDIASTGLNQSNVVVRGFNNIFSGALLVLTDNRIARVPSLRFNAYNFIPTNNDDIEKIEIVSGPGSALYGPNAAAGVLHMITKSPFAHPGTTIGIGGGERNLFIGTLRHAGIVGEKVAYKITGQYYQGDDWKNYEPQEPDSIALYRPTSTGNDTTKALFPNVRDFNIEKKAFEARVDYAHNDYTKFIINGGFSQANSIELTGLGAGQAKDWLYYFGQMQFTYKDLYIQAFANMSDAGDTYLLNTGQMIVDKSKLWVAQIQHFYQPKEWLGLIYGVDALFTRPNTESTINGTNEEDDNINEIGGYLQAEAQLNEKFKLIGAARLDDNNRLEDIVFSPRAALTFQPNKNHNFRATYNRAYSTPDNNNLYLDILQTNDLGGVGEAFEGAFPGPFATYRPEFDIRVQGVPETGFNFRFSDDGNPMYRSPFNVLDPSEYIELNDITFTNTMWDFASGAVMSGVEGNLSMAVLGGLIDQTTMDAIMLALDNATPDDLAIVGNVLRTLNPDDAAFELSTISDIANIGRLEPTITNTFELGYNGLIGNKLKFTLDVYRTEKDNFIGPLAVETPNVFLDPTTLQTELFTDYSTYFASGNTADSAALAAFFDAPANGGNGNGTAADELTALFTSEAAAIPFGTVTPDEANDPTAVMVTYRNFGNVTYYGADFSLAYRFNQHWTFGGSYSYISKNHFEKDANNVNDINLNAPRHKGALQVQYNYPKLGLNILGRARFVDSFEMDSPFYGDLVGAYGILDINAGIDFIYKTRFSLTVQNVTNNKHIEFIGGPELGRLAIARITATL